MIEQVNNLTIKSFNNYTGPLEKFKSKNIIFGYNGRGKSALSEGIIKEFLKISGNKFENYRYFNKDYITRNLTLQESDNPHIKGIVANFGKENIDVDNQIDELTKKIVNIDALQSKISSLDNEIKKEIISIFLNKKGRLNIKNKATNLDVLEIIRLYEEDLIKALKIENNKKKILSLVGDDALEVEKEKVEKLPKLIIKYYEFANIDVLKEIFSKSYDNLDIPSSEIIFWLNKGYALHNENDKCKFCGNDINLSEIKEKLNVYNSNIKQKDKLTLSRYVTEIINIIDQLDKYVIREDIFVELISSDVSETFAILRDNLTEFKKIGEIINNKLQKIENKFSYDFDSINELLKSTNYNLEILNNQVEEKTKNLQNQIDNLSVLIKGAICLEIENNTYISNKLEERNETLQSLNKGIDNNKLLTEQIKNLKLSKSNTSDFANYISEILQTLEVNLKIDVDNNDYILRHAVDRNIIKLSDISEGEKNLLMLIYLYYELFEDQEQQKFKDEIKLIILDDPITSMDNVNRMYILSLIDKMCNIENIQLFVFTHIWEDFCQISYNKKVDKTNPKYGFFEIKKENNNSQIVIANKNVSPYEHDFKEVLNYHKKMIVVNCLIVKFIIIQMLLEGF